MTIANMAGVSSIYAGNAGWNLSSTLTATLMTVDAEKTVKINILSYSKSINYTLIYKKYLKNEHFIG